MGTVTLLSAENLVREATSSESLFQTVLPGAQTVFEGGHGGTGW